MGMVEPKVTAAGTLPAVSLLRTVFFPGMRCPVLLQGERACAALRAALEGTPGRAVAVFAAQPGAGPDAGPEQFCRIGTIARVNEPSRRPCCGRWTAVFEGLARVRSIAYVRAEPFREVRWELLEEAAEDTSLLHGMVAAIGEAARELNRIFPNCEHTLRAVARLRDLGSPDELPGAVIDLLQHLPTPERQRLLETDPLSARLEATIILLRRRLAESHERTSPEQ
jgi:ATP-dependent Lon protease